MRAPCPRAEPCWRMLLTVSFPDSFSEHKDSALFLCFILILLHPAAFILYHPSSFFLKKLSFPKFQTRNKSYGHRRFFFYLTYILFTLVQIGKACCKACRVGSAAKHWARHLEDRAGVNFCAVYKCLAGLCVTRSIQFGQPSFWSRCSREGGAELPLSFRVRWDFCTVLFWGEERRSNGISLFCFWFTHRPSFSIR